MLDQVDIEIFAGNGGAGAVSFHREKFVPNGGPDGGKGGRGGHVIVLATDQAAALRRYRRTRHFRAEAGNPGTKNNMRGRDGQDLILEVPTGTVVHAFDAEGDALRVVADLDAPGKGVIAAFGGRGGFGNTHFKSATNRAPRVAQRGQKGQRLKIRLELRVIADVGIVGLPNAGKSTLLRQLSAARPRVAAYPFTTLEPHLGVVAVGWDEFVLADLPGLIEGAAEGAGLGHDFLRHTDRTRLLVHLIDGAAEDPLAAYDLINRELAAYSETLAARPQIVAINKIDIPAVEEQQDALRAAFQARGVDLLFLSAASGAGTEDLVKRCAERLAEIRSEAAARRPVGDVQILRPQADRRRWAVTADRPGVFRVHGGMVEAFVEMMDVEDDYAVDEIYRWFTRRGITAALRKAGIARGDRVKVGDAAWEWET